jgi:hypothetical protein
MQRVQGGWAIAVKGDGLPQKDEWRVPSALRVKGAVLRVKWDAGAVKGDGLPP